MAEEKGMNAAQVRAKARIAVERREEQIEAEEIEGGEINLIPYLDIVTNLMLFLLASISTGLVMGQINTTLPDQGDPGKAAKVKADVIPRGGRDPKKAVVDTTSIFFEGKPRRAKIVHRCRNRT